MDLSAASKGLGFCHFGFKRCLFKRLLTAGPFSARSMYLGSLCFAWPPAALALSAQRRESRGVVTRTGARWCSSMCALQRIAEIAKHAGRRRQSEMSTSGSPHSSRGGRSFPGLGPCLSEDEMNKVESLVRNVSGSSLGVFEDNVERAGTEIGYISVADKEDVTMAVFIMPPGSMIPLHDHNGMFVASRILFGRLEVHQYDLLHKKGSETKKTREGVRHPVSFSEAGETRVLTPTKGNIHSFHADRWTAVFDVLMPPYRTEDGVDCKYYEAISLNEGNRKKTFRQGQERVLLKVSLFVLSFFLRRAST